MVASIRWLRGLCWALVVLAVIAALVSLLFATGILRPPHDVEDLVNVTQLTAQGVGDVNVQELKLERHARVTKPDVFAAGAPARPMP